jgi:FkbM family methyltransferase
MKSKITEYFKLIYRIGFLSATTYKALNFLSIKKPLRVNLFGHKVVIRSLTPDLSVALSNLGEEFSVLSGLLDKKFEGIIVDAGGYIGTSSLKLSDLYPNAKVIAIEPSSENYKILKQNTKKNKNITVIQAALAPISKGDIVLSNRGTGEWGFTIISNPKDNPRATHIEKVKTITLSEIRGMFDHKEIGLMKLDIEGGEKDLIEKDSKNMHDIYAIFAELHDRIIDGCTDAFKGLSPDRIVLNFGGEKYLSVKKNEFSVQIKSN